MIREERIAMYTTHLIYIETKSRIDVYTRDNITPVELQNASNLNTRIYVSVDTEGFGTHVLDYSRMIVDYEETVQATTWEEYDSVLTDGLVLGYETHLPAYTPGTKIPTNPVKVWDALAVFNTFNLDYGDYFTGHYNVYSRRWLLHDLRISIQENCSSVTPNLSRCIPVVNGFVCRPSYDLKTKALFALNGAKLCWHNTKHSTPEVQLLDFTDIANLEVISIHTQDNYVNGNALFTKTADDTRWYFTFNDYSLTEYTPILVLGGIMILPDQYTVIGTNQLYINVDMIPFNKAIPLRKMLEEDPVTPAEVAYAAKPYHEFLKNEFNTEFSNNCFIIMVKTNRLYINRSGTLDSWKNYNTINDFTLENAILINNSTNTIRNFHLDVLPDRNELIIQNHENIYISSEPRHKIQISFIRPDCRHHNFQDVNHCKCTGLKILGDNA